MNEPEVKIEFLGGLAPVAARGTINGKPFAFHARWDGWAFTVALHPEVDPEGIARNDERSFYMEGDYGVSGSYDASYMPEADAELIIRNCIKVFMEQHGR